MADASDKRDRPVWLQVVALVALVAAVRVALLWMASAWLTSRHPALGLRDLSLFYDGRLYLLVARSFPFVYQNPGSDPIPVDYPNLTIYFPLLPAAIWAVAKTGLEWRSAALVAPFLAGLAAVLLFARLAAHRIERPLRAAALFAVLPAEWVLATTLPFAESVLLLASLAALAAFASERHVTAAICAGLAAVAQKSGFLVAGILVLALLADPGRRRLRSLLPYGLAALPALAMQAYLGSVFGDPLINLRATRDVYGAGFFSFPGLMVLNGWFNLPALGGGSPWPLRVSVLLSLAFYGGALWVSRGDAHPWSRTLRIWVGVILAFNLCLGGAWAYYNFPRFMVLAAPAALLLWVARFEARMRPLPVAALVGAGAIASIALSLASIRDAVGVFEKTGVIPKLPGFVELFF